MSHETLSLDLFDPCAKPMLQRPFKLNLIILEVLRRISSVVQRYVMAGKLIAAMFRRNEINQVTFRTRMRLFGKRIVDASQRVAEWRSRFPWRSNGSAITALLKKA